MPANWANQTIWTGDNLDIMRGMNSESVDLVYLDPPFNSKTNYAAPIGSQAAGAAFKDTWALSDLDVEWINLIEDKHPSLYRVLLTAMTGSDKSYLVYMAARILEMKRLLNPAGSIYLHCDPTMSHYLKVVMDAIFGKRNFRNEIAWCYRGGGRESPILGESTTSSFDMRCPDSASMRMRCEYPTREKGKPERIFHDGEVAELEILKLPIHLIY